MREIKKKIAEKLFVSEVEAEKIIEKAEAGLEINSACPAEVWLEKRLLPNTVIIDQDGYAKMCVDALKILGTTAATDYGSSRQRDMGQLWADMTRGYLGEYAFALFLKTRWKMESELGHESGNLKEFLPMDIHRVREEHGEYRVPKIKLSVKTTKWNGIWLDIPGDQFNHSDIHILIKVGAGRDHLFAFFKAISVFKDKVLKAGEAVGSLTPAESTAIFDNLPSFKPIPAYICGFVRKTDNFKPLDYTGKKGKKHFTITSWNGPINPGDLEVLKRKENIHGDVKFEGIGSFAHDKGYLFNAGNLLWKEDNWQIIRKAL